MRFIKRQSTNDKSPIRSKGIVYNINDEVIMDSRRVMLVPVGNTIERPATAENGHVRYNTDSDEFELFQNNAWRKMRFKEPRQIYQQNLGNGDDVSVLFGPLNSDDPDYPIPTSAQSIIVLIENVFQISTTNYDLVQNPSSTGTGQEITADNIQSDIEYVITSPGSTDFTAIGAANNSQGTVFVASGASTGTGLVRPTGWYIEFGSAVPIGKPVTVLHNFDK